MELPNLFWTSDKTGNSIKSSGEKKMKIAIRYYTKSGNTAKLAKAIEEVTGVKAETVEVPLTEPVDILFLGSSVYAAGVSEKIKEFIRNLKPELVGEVVNFSTAALIPSTYKQVSSLLSEKGIKLDEREFHCKGRFHMIHKTRPDENDINEMKKFAKEIIG